jgi:hypothetical protein
MRAWMKTGTVRGFSTSGVPIVKVDAPGRIGSLPEVVDIDRCFRLLNPDGTWVRETTDMTV